jgi:histidinol dehydrogenase
MATRLDSRDKGFPAAFQALLEAKRETATDVDDAVARILADVREKGDAAVIAYTRQFDGFELTARTMRLTASEIAAARAQVDKDVLAALELAAGRIADFHARQAPKGLDFTDAAGLRLGYRWTPIAPSAFTCRAAPPLIRRPC